MDGQQWIWVAAVLVGAAWAGAVVVFGRRKRPTIYSKIVVEIHEEDDDDIVADIDEGGAPERRPRHL